MKAGREGATAKNKRNGNRLRVDRVRTVNALNGEVKEKGGESKCQEFTLLRQFNH